MCMYITTCMCVHAGSVTVSLIKAKPANDNTCTYNGTIPINIEIHSFNISILLLVFLILN